MNKTELERKVDVIMSAIEQRKPLIRGFVSMSAFEKTKSRVFWSLWLIPILLGAIIVWKFHATGHAWVALLTGGGVGGVGAAIILCISLALHENCSRNTLWDAISNGIYALKNKAPPLTAKQAKSISTWCETYPRIDQVCVKWGAYNRERCLSRPDYRVIRSAVLKLEAAQEAHTEYQKEMSEQLEVRAAINRTGLIDRMEALAQSEELQGQTPQAVHVETARRI